MYYSKSKMVTNRTINYRFSIKDRSDQMLHDQKRIIVLHNEKQQAVEDSGKEPHYLRVRVRPRGPRQNNGKTYYAFTPDFLATHYDVYVVRDSEKMKAYRKTQVGAKGTLKSFITDKIELLDAVINGKPQTV